MHDTLYLPQQPPQAVPVEGLSMPDPATGFARVPERVPVLLDCAPELVDVLASGPGYVAYSVFDCEGPANPAAMVAVAAVSGVAFDSEDEDTVLRGAVLVVTG
ncbi:hypothetical protein [Hymenobacter psoromatis]|uniref:hypothetical protein n=1 Tax=Hymenobacter psoromatis TaxID=1484116 RepID=UPI001CC0D191|nr:hypothetical protein [Hymenobacter psoromatis]